MKIGNIKILQCLQFIQKDNRLHFVPIRIRFIKISVNIHQALGFNSNTSLFVKFTHGCLQRSLPELHSSTRNRPCFLITSQLQKHTTFLVCQNPTSKIQDNLIMPHLGANIGNIVHIKILSISLERQRFERNSLVAEYAYPHH